MAQPITPALEARLASKLQVGLGKPRGEIEIDHIVSVGTGEFHDSFGTDATWKTLQLSWDGGTLHAEPAGFKLAGFDDSTWDAGYVIPDPNGAWHVIAGCSFLANQSLRTLSRIKSAIWITRQEFSLAGLPDTATLTLNADDGLQAWVNGTQVVAYPGPGFATETTVDILPYLVVGDNCVAVKITNSAVSNVWTNPTMLQARVDLDATGSEGEVVTATIQTTSINVDRSRKMAAAQLDVVLPNEHGERGWYTQPNAIATPNNPIRAYAWLGDRDDRVQIYTGLIDRVHEHRNPKVVSLKARSRMKWLLEQKFRATAPQGADETGAVRTEDNGVYLGKTIEYIVGDILDRAGWPSADRAIATTGVTLAEYDLTDGGTWAEQIAGGDRLTAAASCDLVEDELGVIHFEPSPLIDASEPTPAWAFAAGVNVMALDHEVDDENRATRVEVTGPMTSAVPKWEQVWSTAVLDHPVGAWYDSTDPDNLRVVDRVSKYIYTIRQSDRAIIAKKYLGGYPLGLSGIPGDTTHYLVLHAPWRNTGSTTGNSVKRYLKSDNSLVSTSTLPDGRWSALKSDGTNLWLTNYDDGKLYKKTYVAGGAATAVASYTIVDDDGETQTQATGLWINGTTIGVFFSPHKRFLIVDTSAPATVTGEQSTQGTRIAGGESDTDTDIDLYAVASKGSFGLDSGMVAKFTLAELVTTDVSALAIDYDLEDALGLQSGIAARDHGDCPNDAAPHPYEARLLEYSMKVVQSFDQAEDMAAAQLALLSRLRRAMDLATLGHPGIQLNDPVSYTDTPAGIAGTVWIVDTLRIRVAKTYTQTMSTLPWEAP